MAWAAKPPCRARGCWRLARDRYGYCDEHDKFKIENEQHKQNGGRKDDAIYNTTRWRKLRKYKLDTCPCCAECHAIATMVDHIKRIRDGGDPFDYDNLQSMCDTCHAKKRQRESMEGRGGKISRK